MSRKPIRKELENTRLLKEYASWIYCTGCEKTVAYLCYVTYDLFEFDYTCGCGSHGRVSIEFAHEKPEVSDTPLKPVKNRLCCPKDGAPLVTVVDKNVTGYRLRVLCNTCHTEYTKSAP